MPVRRSNITNRQLDRRFSEIEKSVRAIAAFVKDQNKKNRHMVQESLKSIKIPEIPKVDTTKYDMKIDSLEREMDEVRKAKLAASPNIENFKSKVNVLDEKIIEIDNKLAHLEAKGTTIKVGEPHEIDAEINERLQEQGRKALSDFEKRIRSLKTEFDRVIDTRVEKSLSDEAKILKDYVDREVKKIQMAGGSSKDYEHFYDDLRKTNSKIFDIEKQLKSLPSSKTLEESFLALESKIKGSGEKDTHEMINKMTRMKNELDTFATKHDLDAIKKFIVEENKNQKIFNELETLRSSSEEQSAIHKSIDKRIQDVERHITNLKIAESAEEKADKRDVEDKIYELRNLLRDVSTKSSAMIKEARDSQKKLEAKLTNVATKDEVARIRETENRIRNKFIMEFATKADLDEFKRSDQNIDKRIINDIGQIKAVNEEQDVMHDAIEKRLQDLEKRIETSYAAETAQEKSDMRNVGGRIAQLSKLLDEERSKRANMANHIHELENRLSHMQKERKKTVINKEIESQMGKTISKHLGEFSKVMDKRLPNVVTREQHMAFIKDIDNRLQHMEVPDVSNVLHRIQRLESQINEINSMAKDVYNRIPVIVE